jgi:hypothetical protein
MAELDQSGVDADTLDRMEIIYEVKASFLINAGVYSGVVTPDVLAEHINSRGVIGEDIDSVSIAEVRIDDKVVARA